MAAHEPPYAAGAIMYTCFHLGNAPLLEMASPSFRLRMIFMMAVTDGAALKARIPGIDVRPLSAKLAMLYLVMAVYASEEHGTVGSRSSQLGSPFFLLMPIDLPTAPPANHLKAPSR